MKIFDCFTFFNELDILDLRLNYLNEYVDYFILVEANKTHSGISKPFYFEDNKKKFERFEDKIIHIKVEFDTKDMLFKKKNMNDLKFEIQHGKIIDDFWTLEMNQRENIIEGLKDSCDDDVILISDVDEIPNIESIEDYVEYRYEFPVSLEQLNHYYYLNCVQEDYEWIGTVIVKKKNLKSPSELRCNRHGFLKFYNGGWHFSYLGGEKNILEKISSFAHSEFNNPYFLDMNKLKNKINNCEDIFERGLKFRIIDLIENSEKYPNYLIENSDKYKKFINYEQV